MKERPILFSAPMVRAILDGSKTQTRRIVKPQPNGAWSTDPCVAMKNGLLHWAMNTPSGKVIISDLKCPYGKPGDQLWVRETWCPDFDPYTFRYKADGGEPLIRWRPSIHMPRWASRTQLEVLNVRVERLQDISQAGCIAEGVEYRPTGVVGWDLDIGQRFADLWSKINGPESWDANPWVWRIEFQKIERK